MEDPVMLPSSNQILDRNTIETILLSEALDPFNRAKLTKEELIECVDLRKKIEEYKLKKKEEKLTTNNNETNVNQDIDIDIDKMNINTNTENK